LAALKLLSNHSIEQSVRGKDVYQAENYVLRLVQNQALDLLRSQKVRRHEEISDVIEDPKSWQALGEIIPPREIDQLRRELERAVSPTLLPDLPLYFDLLLDGYSNKQIAEDKLLSSLKAKPMTQQGLAKYRDKIKDVLRGHFNVQASANC
jgi:DNA-directed RNA polymerase specialized sigma24 family protein